MGSGVTNFLSVVEARSLGTADIDKMATAIDKQSAALQGLGKSGDKVNEHPGFNAFAEKVKQGIENPLQAIGGAAESALGALGPLGVGVAAIGGGFLAAGFAAFEAAKGLGEYGTQIANVAIRTGLTTKEVGQFSFAAKVAGQDVSVFESAMRKLSQGLDDNSAEGAKARKGLADLGVSSRDATGAMRPMSDIFLQISHGLNGIEDPAKRNTEALKLFGRAGIELMPTMLGLSENIKRAKELGLGATDEDLKRWEIYHKNVVEAEALWDKLARRIKEPLAAAITILFKDSSGRAYSLEDLAKRGVNLGQWTPRTQFGDEQAAKAAGFGAAAGYSTNIALDAVSGYTNQIEARRSTDAAISRLFGGPQTLDQQLKAAEESLSGLSRPTKGSSSMEDVTAYGEAQHKVEALKAQIEGAKEAAKTLAVSVKAAISAIEAQTKLDNDYTGKLISGASKLHQIQNPAEAPPLMSDQALSMLSNWRLFGKGRGSTGDLTGEGFSQWYNENQFHTGQRELKDTRDNERRGMSLYGVSASLGGVSETDQINTAAALRKKYADAEYDALLKMAEAKNDDQAKQDAIDQQHQKYLDAEIERQQALLQMALRQKQEFQSLVVGGVEALLHGQGGSFLKSQGTGIMDKVLGNAAGMAWKDVSKIIPHAGGGTMGKLLEGTMFGADPMKGATDLNTLATVDNTTELRLQRTQALSASGGGGGFSPSSSTFARLLNGGAPTDAEIAAAGITPEAMAALQKVPEMGPNQGSGFSTMSASPKGGFGWGKAVGIGGAAVAGGIGAYEGFSQGGARGDLTGAGSLAGAAGTIMMLAGMTGPAAPIVAGIGLALGLIPSLMGDPKKQRADQLSQDAQQRAYTMPSGSDYSLDARGRYTDYDYQGKGRSVAVTNNVYAMDSTSFRDFLIANPGALSSGITSAIAGGNGEDMVGLLQGRNS
jgi:hypothetical protein